MNAHRCPDGTPLIGDRPRLPIEPLVSAHRALGSARSAWRRGGVRRAMAAAVLAGVGAGAWLGVAGSAPEATAQVQLASVSEVAPVSFVDPASQVGQPVCDVPSLISQITADPTRAAAWARAEGIRSSEIPAFAQSLIPSSVPANIGTTEYRYTGGQPVPTSVVLRAGTAVLLDARGAYRVTCSGDDPLAVPTVRVTGYYGTDTTIVTPPPVEVTPPRCFLPDGRPCRVVIPPPPCFRPDGRPCHVVVQPCQPDHFCPRPHPLPCGDFVACQPHPKPLPVPVPQFDGITGGETGSTGHPTGSGTTGGGTTGGGKTGN